jgi:cation diffusion facilitator family transporter
LIIENQCVTDSANNILGLITSKLANPYPDREHPYGHHKYEAVVALGIAALLGIACFEIVKGAIDRLLMKGTPIVMEANILWLLFLVLGINIVVAYYERYVGKKLQSPILMADAYHTMSDIWVTIIVIVGLIGVLRFRCQKI